MIRYCWFFYCPPSYGSYGPRTTDNTFGVWVAVRELLLSAIWQLPFLIFEELLGLSGFVSMCAVDTLLLSPKLKSPQNLKPTFGEQLTNVCCLKDGFNWQVVAQKSDVRWVGLEKSSQPYVTLQMDMKIILDFWVNSPQTIERWKKDLITLAIISYKPRAKKRTARLKEHCLLFQWTC